MKKNLKYIALFVTVFLALIIRLYPITANMPYLYWHDENNYVESAMRFGSGNFNPMSFYHGGLYQLLLFLMYGAYFIFERIVGSVHSKMDFYLNYIKDPTPFFLIARGISVFCGIGAIYLTYAIGSRIYNKNVGLAASLFASFSFLMIQTSPLALADTTTVFILLVSFLILIRSVKKPHDSIMYYISCLIMGLAIACKYYVAFGVVSLYVAALIKSMDSVNRWRSFFRLAIIGSFFVFVGFAMSMPYSIIRFTDFYRDAFIKMGEEYILRNPNKNTWLFYFTHHLKNGLGIPLEIVAIFGVIYAFYKRSQWDALILSFPVAYYLLFMHSVGHAYHMLPAMPFLFILAARFLDESSRRLFYRFSAPILICISILVVIPTLMDSLKYVKVLVGDDTRTQAKSWIENNIPSGSLILSEGYLSTVAVHAPPVGENITTLKRDIDSTLRSGGSGFFVKTKIANFERLYGSSRCYDVIKVDALAKRDIETSMPDYIITTSENDKDTGMELAHYYSKEYYKNRKHLRDFIAMGFMLIKSYPPTCEFTMWFPHMVDYDYRIIRKVSLGDGKKFTRGPRIEIYKRK